MPRHAPWRAAQTIYLRQVLNPTLNLKPRWWVLPLIGAATCGALLIVLLVTGMWHVDREESLCTAAWEGDSARVQQLLREGVSPDATFDGVSALHAASMDDRIPIAEILLRAGANPNFDSYETALDVAHSKGMKALLRAHGGLNSAQIRNR
jgi:hypothetical protein